MDMFVPVLWMVVLILFLVFEIMTLGLTSVWFAGGALVAFIVAVCGANPWIQIIVFLVVSLVLLFTVRPIAGKYFNNNRQKTNIDALVGRQGVVTVQIDNLKGQGEISLAGQMWTARSANDTIIEEKAQVEIVSIEGVKAIVKKI